MVASSFGQSRTTIYKTILCGILPKGELEKAGAKIHEGDAKGKKVTASVIGDIRKGVSPQFDAWVSWTKSF